jgi:hypothetical protein
VTSADDPRSPSLDFSLYGLAQWDGSKWAQFFEGEIGRPVCSVWLAHADDNQLILVKTAPRERWDRNMAWGEADTAVPADVGEANFAFSLLTPLLDMACPLAFTGPQLPNEDRRRYRRGIVPFAEKESGGWDSWEIVRWTLGERVLAARVFRFAHGWTGFSADEPDYYLGVTAFNQANTTIDLALVTGDSYNFDFSKSFGIQDLQHQVSSQPDVELIIRAPELHPDHLLVMATEPMPDSLPIRQFNQ